MSCLSLATQVYIIHKVAPRNWWNLSVTAPSISLSVCLSVCLCLCHCHRLTATARAYESNFCFDIWRTADADCLLTYCLLAILTLFLSFTVKSFYLFIVYYTSGILPMCSFVCRFVVQYVLLTWDRQSGKNQNAACRGGITVLVF